MLKPLFYLVLSILTLAYDARPLQSQYTGDRKPNPNPSLRRRLMPVPVHATPHTTPHSSSHSTSRSHSPNASKSVVLRSESHKAVDSSPNVKDAVARIEDVLRRGQETPTSRKISPRERIHNEPMEVTVQHKRNRGTGVPNRKVDLELVAGKKLEDVPKIDPLSEGELDLNKYIYEVISHTLYYPFERYYLGHDQHGYPKIPEGYDDLIHMAFHSYVSTHVNLLPGHWPNPGVALGPKDYYVNHYDDILEVYERELHNMERYHNRVDRFIKDFVDKDFQKAAETEHQLLKDRAAGSETKNEQEMREGQQIEAEFAVEIPHIFEYWRIVEPREYVKFAREFHDPSYPGYKERRKKSLKEIEEANQELKEQLLGFHEASIPKLKERPNLKEESKRLVMDKIREAEEKREMKDEKKRDRKDVKKPERKGEKKRERKDETKPERKDKTKPERKDETKRERKDEKKPGKKDETKRERKDETKRERKDEKTPERKDETKRERKDVKQPERKDEKKRERKDEKKPERKDKTKRERKDEKKPERKDDRDGK